MRARTLILTTTAAPGAALPLAQTAGASRSQSCGAPSRPAVVQLTPTSATFTAAANPGGMSTIGRFRIDQLLTYPVMLGNGHEPIAWRMTISSLAPGHRYTVVAQANGRGCRSERGTAFTTPPAPKGRIAAATATRPPSGAVEVATSDPAPYDSWSW